MMSKKIYKSKGIGSPLFPDVRYVSDRKTKKLNRKDKALRSIEANMQSNEEKVQVKTKVIKPEKSKAIEKIVALVATLLIISLALFSSK